MEGTGDADETCIVVESEVHVKLVSLHHSLNSDVDLIKESTSITVKYINEQSLVLYVSEC